MEPRTRESRGFAFVTMDTVKDADRCIKYLNQSVLEGRYITVERVTLTSCSIDFVGTTISFICLTWRFSDHSEKIMRQASVGNNQR